MEQGVFTDPVVELMSTSPVETAIPKVGDPEERKSVVRKVSVVVPADPILVVVPVDPVPVEAVAADLVNKKFPTEEYRLWLPL